ncbi:YciI family protein [Sphingomonas sp.]|uniref:YciI family protein n=1 Tax=Sphingomonas sp. TaxID=28214 RepID=UPI001DEE68A9|nr:YciI family protein [Sphingomonas sp.]MBX9796232.1 YciI family protein [Sphingomonas sp.]
MKYMLMIFENEAVYDDGTGAAMNAIIEKHMAFSAGLGDTLLNGAGLQPVATATTVRTQNGQQMLHDGPFAETKEQFGGFYLVEAADLDAAIAIARRIPLAANGSVEVRPVMAPPGM